MGPSINRPYESIRGGFPGNPQYFRIMGSPNEAWEVSRLLGVRRRRNLASDVINRFFEHRGGIDGMFVYRIIDKREIPTHIANNRQTKCDCAIQLGKRNRNARTE